MVQAWSCVPQTCHIGAADVPVTLEVWPHMIHAWHLWAARLSAGRQAIASAGAFISGHLG